MQEAPAGNCCPLQQGLSDHYNSHITSRAKPGQKLALAQGLYRFVLIFLAPFFDVVRHLDDAHIGFDRVLIYKEFS